MTDTNTQPTLPKLTKRELFIATHMDLSFEDMARQLNTSVYAMERSFDRLEAKRLKAGMTSQQFGAFLRMEREVAAAAVPKLTSASEYLQSVLTTMKDIQRRLDQLAEGDMPVPETFRLDCQKLDREAGDLFDSMP